MVGSQDRLLIDEARFVDEKFFFRGSACLDTETWGAGEVAPQVSLALRGKRNPQRWLVSAQRVGGEERIEFGARPFELSCERSEMENACLLAGQDSLVSLLVQTPLGQVELPAYWNGFVPEDRATRRTVDVELESAKYLVVSTARNGRVSLSHCAAADIETKRQPIQAILTQVRLRGGNLKLRGRVRSSGGAFEVQAAEIRFVRQNTDTGVSCPAEIVAVDTGTEDPCAERSCDFRAKIHVAGLLDDGSFTLGKWHARLVLHLKDGRQLSERLRRPLRGLARRHAFRSYGRLLHDGSGFLAFPELTVPGYLVLTIRVPTEADSYFARLKQALALVLAVTIPNLRDRRAWLITEKKSDSAQDNSVVFFRYCYEQHHERPVYYLIRRKSQHRERLRDQLDRVVDFGSLRHYMLLLRCGVLVSSEASAHFLEFDAVPSLYKFIVRLKKFVFLQHGVTAMKNVAGIFGRKGQWAADRFITTSAWEQEIAIMHLGYSPEQAPITGFARWDLLRDRSAGRRQIMVMPTWRNWLHHEKPEEFTQSEFFTNYRNLLQAPELVDLLNEHDASLLFVLHPYLEKFSGHFQASSERVKTIEAGARPINELLMESSILVSDYSSVVWDFFKMKKPVIFFQFDADEYLKRHGSFIDFEKDLIGPRALSVDGVLGFLRRSLQNESKIQPEFEAIYRRTFAHDDRNNCARIYSVVEEFDKERFHELRKFWKLIWRGK